MLKLPALVVGANRTVSVQVPEVESVPVQVLAEIENGAPLTADATKVLAEAPPVC